MDIKKLSRGDAVIGIAALLIFIFSFMNYVKAEAVDAGVNAWSGYLAPTGFTVVLTPILAAILFILGGVVPALRDKQILGLTLRQWALPLTILAPIAALWSTAHADQGTEMAAGGILIILLVIVLVAAMIATTLVPALQAPLLPAGGARPQQQQQQYGQQGPGGQQYGGAPYGGPQGPQGQQGPQSYGGPQGGLQGGGPQGYGGQPQGPQGGYAGQAPQPHAAQPNIGASPAGGQAPFQPFWFSVPETRPMLDEHTNQEKGVLNTGVWYLAVAEHPGGLLVEVDNVRGVLQNTMGIQRS